MRKFCLSGLVAILPALALALPSNKQELQRQAVQLYQSGQYRAAIPLYRQLADMEPENASVQKDLQVLLWLDHRSSESVEVGERLTALAPEDLEAWFIYARSLLASGRREEALAAFRRCQKLAPGQKEIDLGEGRLEGILRNYDAALPRLRVLVKRDPEFKEAWLELARVEQAMDHYPEAAAAWSQTVAFYPDRKEFIFHEAECLFYNGQRDAAMGRMRSLAAADPPYWPAIDFLTDDALARGDNKSARELLESKLVRVRLDDEGRLLKLARIYQQEKRWTDVIAVCDRWLELNSGRGAPWMLKADALRESGRPKEAIQTYQKVVEMNPSARWAWLGLARVNDEEGRPREALKAIEKVEALDPTDPYLAVLKAYYLYSGGDVQGARNLLKKRLEAGSEPVLPVLLYHGLIPFPEGPLLAYAVHRTTATFEDHLQALRAAGYQAITSRDVPAWLKGERSPYEKPILITFDDARLDSLKYGDPILGKFGFRATMFAPVTDVEGYLAHTAIWKDLESHQQSGRWEIASHGDRAHEQIRTDVEGHRALFLLNKEWLSKEARLESDEEWARRARADDAGSRDKIADHLGTAPNSFAFPDGDFGQIDIPNSPASARNNLDWAREVYKTAWHEDDYGLNVRSRDPMMLTRYEPPPGMTGAALLRHLTDDPPAVLMVRRLLRMEAAEGRVHEAMRWLDDLRQRRVSDLCLWSEDARIRLALGDREEALQLARKVQGVDKGSDDTRELLEAIENSPRWIWQPGFYYMEDNRNRTSRRFRQDFGTWHTAGFDLSLHQITASYTEAGVGTSEEGGGFDLIRRLGDFHEAWMEATGHQLSGSADDTYSAFGGIRSAWTDDVRTELEGGRTIYDTGLAIASNVTRRFGSGLVAWEPEGGWKTSLRVRGESLSDSNTRETVIAQAGRQMFWPKFYLTGRVWLDNMAHINPDYYSPQELRDFQLGLDYGAPLGKNANFHLLYLPGYGKEENTSGEFVQDLDFKINLTLSRSMTLTPSVVMVHTPSYHRLTYGSTLTCRF